MADRRFPLFSRKNAAGVDRIVPDSAPVVIDVPLERKDAATRRASVGRGYTFANQPYVPNGGDIERLVKDGYEKVIWVFKGVDATAEKLSSWPIEAMKGKEPSWRSVDDDVLTLLNDYTNQIERAAKYFRYRLISQLMMSKRGVFVEAIPTRGGQLAALNLLPPAYTSCLPDPDKFLAGFRVDVPGMEGHIDLPVYDPEKKAGVVWIRKPHPTDPYSSITPLEAAGISIDLDFYARLYNRNFLLNDGRAGQIVAVKGGLSPDDARELKARFTPGMSGAGRTTVIEADTVSVSDTATTPRDAQYAELRDITKQDLLAAIGTPMSLWDASGRTFDNADAEKENWLDVTVLPLGGVMTSGMDVLTEGGYDDDVRLRHDVSNEPVLKRRHQAKVDQARKDVAAGLISIKEFREIAEKDPVEAAGARVLWIPSGKVGIGGDEGDEGEVAALKPVGGPPTGPVDGSMGGFGASDLGGFDAELDALTTPQDPTTALTTAGEDLSDLESKAFNPKQPRYPMSHPQGGQFMDTGDVALWLAGKPLKNGTLPGAVGDPNPGSTASPSPSVGGGGGASRFLTHADPKVRAAAAVISFPPSYVHPRVLGAPPAKDLAGPKHTKLVSLRKGDVVLYQGPSAGGKQGPWAVAAAKRAQGGNVELELVNDDGDVIALAAGAQMTIAAIARTPHPTVVAQAKRDVTAAARAMGSSPAAPAPVAAAAAPAPPTVTAPVTPAAPAGPVGPRGPFGATDLLPGAVFEVNSAAMAGLPNGSKLTILPNGEGQLLNGLTGTVLARNITHGNVLSLLGSQSQGGGFTLTTRGTPLAPPTPPTPVAPVVPLPAGHGRAMQMAGISGVPGTTVASRIQPGQTWVSQDGEVLSSDPAGGGLTVFGGNSGYSSPRATNLNYLHVGGGSTKKWAVVAPLANAQAAPPVATPGATPTITPTAAPSSGVAAPPSGWVSTLQVVDGARFHHPSSGAELIVQPDGSALMRTTSGATTRNSRLGKAAVRTALGPGTGYLLTSGVQAPQYSLPTPPPGATIYAHPDGKHIYVLPGGGMEVWKPDGTRGTSSATPSKLAYGHGKWAEVQAPATGPRPITPGMTALLASITQQQPAPAAAPPTPAPAASPPSSPAQAPTPTAPQLAPGTLSHLGRAGSNVSQVAPAAPYTPKEASDARVLPKATVLESAAVYADPARSEILWVATDGTAVLYDATGAAVRYHDPGQALGLFTSRGAVWHKMPSLGRSLPHPAVTAGTANLQTPTTPAPAAPAAAVASVAGSASPSSILVPPPNYPYPVVQGAPVATALKAPKAIKVASLRKGDVISQGGQPITVVSVDRASGTITGQNAAGATVKVPAPSGSQLAIARTPHPTVVAAARRAAAQSGPGAGPAPAPAAAAPSSAAANAPQRLRPSMTPGANAAQAARNTGTPQQQGYAPVPGMTYANAGGTVLIVHPDGSGTVHHPGGGAGGRAPIDLSAADVRDVLDPGTIYVPLSAPPRTSKFSIEVGHYTSPSGTTLDVRSDGSGTLTPAGGNAVTITEDQVDNLLNGGNLNPQTQLSRTGWSPSQRTTPGTGQVNRPAAAGPLAAPQPAPAGGWVQAGQVVPGAVFVNRAGDTLSVGPRGGGKLQVQGQPSRNMSAQALKSHLSRRAGQWNLQTPGAAAVAAGSTTTTPGTPAAAQPAPARAARPASGPVFAPNVGVTVTAGGTGAFSSPSALQPGQTFTQPKTGNTMVVQPDGSVLWTAGPRSRASATRVKTYNQLRAHSTMATNGYASTSGPDIDVPGAAHAAAVRRSQAGQPLPPPGTPVQGAPPAGAVYPGVATGAVTAVKPRTLVRGQTVRVGGEDWVVTETHAGPEIWGYRPGIDDPNTLTQDAASKKWRQGVRVPFTGTGLIDLVGPAPTPANNVPTGGSPRTFDPAGDPPQAVTGIGGQHGAPYGITTQTVPADQLKAGDVIVLNGREAEGSFVVTSVGTDSQGRQNVQGYAGTTADATGRTVASTTPVHLFLTNPQGTMRTVRVQVDGAVPPPPTVPRPTPPRGPSSIVRNDISDPTSRQKILDILKSPPPRLSSAGIAITNQGDTMLGHLYEARGYNAHPDVVTEAELDQHVADGEIEIWRGMTQTGRGDVAEDYRSGNHFPGGGASMYGAGTYCAYGDGHAYGASSGANDAIKFTQGSYARGGSGVGVRMTLKADARIGEYDALYRAYQSDQTPAGIALRNKLGIHSSAAVGHYAVLMGYDAIRKSRAYDGSHSSSTSDSWDYGFMVVLNRSAVRISEKNYVPSGSVGSAPAGQSPPPLTMSAAKHKMNSRVAKHAAGVDYRIKGEP